MFGLRKSTVMADEAKSWDWQQRDAGWVSPSSLNNVTPGKSDMLNVGVVISRTRKVRRPKIQKGHKNG